MKQEPRTEGARAPDLHGSEDQNPTRNTINSQPAPTKQRGIVVPIQQHPAKSVSTDPAVLADLARQIRVCMRKSDDYRVTAACHLAQAKVHCRAAKRSFKDWVNRDVHGLLGYTEAVRLAKIGASDDPAKALENHRAGTRARVAKHKAKVALANATPVQPTLSLAAAFEAYIAALNRDDVPLAELQVAPQQVTMRLRPIWDRRIANASPEEKATLKRRKSAKPKVVGSAGALMLANISADLNAALCGGGVS